MHYSLDRTLVILWKQLHKDSLVGSMDHIRRTSIKGINTSVANSVHAYFLRLTGAEIKIGLVDLMSLVVHNMY